MDNRIAECIQTIQHNSSGRIGMLGRDDLPLLEKLAQSTACDIVWPAIEKRIEKAEQLHRERLVEIFGEKLARASEIARTDFYQEVWRLLTAVEEALRPVDFCEGATRSERRKVLADTEKAVATLKRTIVALSMEDAGLITSAENPLREYAESCGSQVISDLKNADTPGWETYRASANEPVVAAIAQLSAGAVSHFPEKYLDALLRGVALWSQDEPIVPRPGVPNSERLRMIRVLTGHFKGRYGSPLRAQVLALVGVFFDTSNLTEADIAKAAP